MTKNNINKKMSKFEPSIDKLKNNPRKYVESLSVKNHVQLLKYLSDAYYNTSQPLIDDEIFDIIKEYLAERDPDNEYLLEVGAPSSKRIVKLPYSMYSLEKIKPDTELLDKWSREYKGPYLVSDKLDGISAQLYKDVNEHVYLFSRGDSTTGQNITHLVEHLFTKKQLKSIPAETSIRGELIISKKNFIKIADSYENARNAVGGLVNSRRLKKKVLTVTEFVGYSMLYPLYTKDKQMHMLQTYGLNVVDHKIYHELTNQLLSDLLEDRRKESEYDIDGIVVFDGSKIYPLEDKNPTYAFAFKKVLDDQVAEATVEDVSWEVSKDRYIKPRIKISPIKLAGVTITYATAFNAKFVFENKLGPGAIVKLVRSGDVIPHIMHIIKPAEEPKMPSMAYEWSSTGVDIIVTNLRANSKVHHQVLVKQFVHFFKTLNVKYINEGIITKLVENGYNTIFKILTLNVDKASLIDGLGEKVLNKIFISFREVIQTTNMASLMYASQVFGRGLGEKKLKLILNEIPDVLEHISDSELKDKINNIEGFSNVTTDKFIENLDEFKLFFKDLNQIIRVQHLIPEKRSETKSESILNGKTIIFTGFRNSDWKKQIESMGGKLSDSVSKNTFVVVHDDDLSSSKIKKAKELNVKTIHKNEFRQEYLN